MQVPAFKLPAYSRVNGQPGSYRFVRRIGTEKRASRHSSCTLSPIGDLGRSLSISYSSNAPENAIP